MRFVSLAFLLALSTAAPAASSAQSFEPPTLSGQSVAEIDKLTQTVTDALLAGDAKRAVGAFAAGSPLMTGKTIELGALEAQIQTTLTAYGPISSMELVKQHSLGSSVVRRYYVARHERMVTRWEIITARTGKGWIIAYFGFDDQQRSWFQ